MAEKGMLVKISAAVLEEFFQCSICLNAMTGTVMTICGHRYCGPCIKEWVDRHRTCPCCNSIVHTARLIKDHQFDGLIEACKAEREAAESAYFENLINTVNDDASQKSMSPVEQVLKRHLKNSLTAHELYFEDLRRQLTAKTHQLELNTRKKIEHLQLDGLTPAALSEKIEELEAELTNQKSAMMDDVHHCQLLVADAFDRYLSEHIPSLHILPVKVTLVLADKGIRIPDVILKPDDILTVVQTSVEEGLVQRGDRVIRWQPDNGKVLMVSPLCRQDQYDAGDMLEDVAGGGDRYPGVQLLPWTSKPVLQHQLKPGSDLVLADCVVCESDLPKVCYATKHKTDGPSKVDYFSCKQCNFKWICRSCIQVCHKDHDVAPFVFNNQPTWACCYCPKKKTCCLQSV